MRGFWEWLHEAVQQQKSRFSEILSTIFPNFDQFSIQRLILILTEFESELIDAEDIRKSATINKFVKNFKVIPEESIAHTIDRFKKELPIAIQTANSKGKTPEQIEVINRQALTKLLPGETPETIEFLLIKVKQGAHIQDVANAYLASKRAVGKQDRMILKQGNLELIEINTWNPSKTLEKHIDQEKGLQSCHVLLKGTKWCVRFQNYFQDYVSSGPLYLVREAGKPVVLGHKDSDWLDVNDEPPDPAIMTKVALFIMESGIGDIAKSVLYYLPQPVQDLEKYINKYPNHIVKMREHLLGNDYYFNKDEIVAVDHFVDLEDTLDRLKNISNNEINVNLRKIERWIEENSMVKTNTKDLNTKDLNSKMESLLEKILDIRYKNNEYGQVDWDELSFEEKLELDEEFLEILRTAVQDTYANVTWDNLYKSINRQLEEGDSNGFRFDIGKDYFLYIKANDVNKFIKNNLENEIKIYGSILKNMNFKIDADNLELEFSSKKYNELIEPQLKMLSQKRLDIK